MPSIDNLKTLLDFNISDGSRNMAVYINENNRTSVNAILLFYNNDNVNYANFRTVEDGYYGNGVQIVCRHKDYDKARTVAYNALQYISKNRKTYAGVIYVPDVEPPYYTGRDDRTHGYTWSFNIFMKGGE